MTAVPDTLVAGPPSPRSAPLPDVEPEPSSAGSQFLVGLFVVVPLLALAAAVPLVWGWGLGWPARMVSGTAVMVVLALLGCLGRGERSKAGSAGCRWGWSRTG